MRRAVAIAVLVACACACDKPKAAPEAAASASAPIAAASASGKHHDRHEAANPNAPPWKLDATVKGKTVTWDAKAFEKVALYTIGHDGDDRTTWSLREIVKSLVGPTARVVSIEGTDGKKTLDAAAWSDAAKTPILHTTRRGTLKFRWADKDGKWGDAEVKDVSKIVVE